MAAEPDSSDPFEVLGLPPGFDLDPAALARAYLGLSARLHPDLASGDPQASARSAAANRARSILENAESRAGAVLARLGGPSKEADRSLPAGFLPEIMETREAVEEAVRSRDPGEIERWRSWAKRRRGEHMARVSSLFSRHATGLPADRAGILQEVRIELNAWRYVERLIEQLESGYDHAESDLHDAR